MYVEEILGLASENPSIHGTIDATRINPAEQLILRID